MVPYTCLCDSYLSQFCSLRSYKIKGKTVTIAREDPQNKLGALRLILKHSGCTYNIYWKHSEGEKGGGISYGFSLCMNPRK